MNKEQIIFLEERKKKCEEFLLKFKDSNYHCFAMERRFYEGQLFLIKELLGEFKK